MSIWLALPTLPLAALDLGAIIQAIIFLVILGSGLVKMFRESQEVQERSEAEARSAKEAEQGPPLGEERLGQQPQRNQPIEAGKTAPPNRPVQDSIRAEVEEFLRRMGQEEQQRRPPQPRPSQQRPLPRQQAPSAGQEASSQATPRRSETPDRSASRPSRKQPPQRLAQPRQSPQQQSPSSTKRPSGSTRASMGGIGVGEGLLRHLAPAEFASEVAELGEELSQTDERLEARLHATFDHQLGSLSARHALRMAADQKREAANDTPVLAHQLLTLLSDPQGVQQAIVVNEILKRPEF